MYLRFILVIQILYISFCIQQVTSNDFRSLQNHRNDIHNLKNIAGHWIGLSKSPYDSYTVTPHPITSLTTLPTSAPISVTKMAKKKRAKTKKTYNKRRRDNGNSLHNRATYRKKQKFDYDDDNFDYDYGAFDSAVGNSYSTSPFVIKGAPSSKTMYANPTTANSNPVKAIYAGKPKFATYVIPSTKNYVVQRVKSEAVYLPPSSPSSDIYVAASNPGVRRLDPLDYDYGGGGNSGLNQGGFPPRPVMNKISQPGQRQPCHGPECHQHHKGLVRFYWRRVVYPPNVGPRRRRRFPFGRPTRGRNQRRRQRGNERAPSDQKDIYFTDDHQDGNEERENTRNPYEETRNPYEETRNSYEEEEDEDNDEKYIDRRYMWKPSRAYGHDLNEGNNYDDQEKRVYRDKRFAYKKQMNRYLKHRVIKI